VVRALENIDSGQQDKKHAGKMPMKNIKLQTFSRYLSACNATNGLCGRGTPLLSALCSRSGAVSPLMIGAGNCRPTSARTSAMA
jgi:hypothetical protein